MGLLAALLVLTPGAAAEERDGLTFGASLGRGSIDVACDGCDGVAPITEALSLTAHVGVLVTPRLSLLAEHWTVRYRDRGSEWFDDSLDHLVAQRITVGGAQAWVTRRLWLRAGVGVGYHISDSSYVQGGGSASGGDIRPASAAGALGERGDGRAPRVTPAYFTAIGYEVAHRSDLAVDVQIRFGATRRPADEYQIYNTAVNFGMSWY